MITIKNHYFKTPYGSEPLMSGLSLPDPAKGPYKFVSCEIHFAIDKILARDYKNSIFVNCDRY